MTLRHLGAFPGKMLEAYWAADDDHQARLIVAYQGLPELAKAHHDYPETAILGVDRDLTPLIDEKAIRAEVGKQRH